MMILTIQTAAPILSNDGDGSGFTVCMPYDGHNARLTIGNVSIAFDGRNGWKRPDNDSYDGFCMEFAEYRDDPVRLGGDSCPSCDDVAETIMYALAADLGYTVSK